MNMDLIQYTVGAYKEQFPFLGRWIEHHAERTRDYYIGMKIRLTEEKKEKLEFALAEGNYHESYLKKYFDSVGKIIAIRQWDDPRVIGYCEILWLTEPQGSWLGSLADVECIND